MNEFAMRRATTMSLAVTVISLAAMGQTAVAQREEPSYFEGGLLLVVPPESDRLEMPWLADITPVDFKDNDSQLMKLIKLRHNVALDDVRERQKLYGDWGVMLDEIWEAVERLTRSGQEIGQPEMHKYLNLEVKAATTWENAMRRRVRDAYEPVQRLRRATANRIAAEMALLRARWSLNALHSGGTQQFALKRSIRTLLAERFQAASEETAICFALYEYARIPLDEILSAIRRRVQSGVEVAETPAEQVKYRKEAVETAKQVEAIARARWEFGSEPIQSVHQAVVSRLDFEIDLLRTHRTVSAAVTSDCYVGTNNLKDIQKLMKERYDEAARIVDAQRASYEFGRLSRVEVLRAVQQQAKSGIEMSTTATERLGHLQVAFEAAKDVETILRSGVEVGIDSLHSLYEAMYYRVDSEIALVRARLAATSCAPNQCQPTKATGSVYQAARNGAVRVRGRRFRGCTKYCGPLSGLAGRR